MSKRNQTSINLSDFPFHYSLQTRWIDMDAFGHINNAVFLSYIEDARVTYFKRWNLYDQKRSIILASVKIDYLRPLNHPSNLIIGERITNIGNKSFDIDSVVFIKDEKDPVASSIITCVCYDYNKGESVSVYSEIIADFERR